MPHLCAQFAILSPAQHNLTEPKQDLGDVAVRCASTHGIERLQGAQVQQRRARCRSRSRHGNLVAVQHPRLCIETIELATQTMSQWHGAGISHAILDIAR